jgi:hypothetical protein
VTPGVYELLVQNDINTTGYGQWFYFAVSGRGAMTFRIVNLYKRKSLYEDGMQPCVCEKPGVWQRGGKNVAYRPSSVGAEDPQHCYSTLSFEYNFEEGRTVAFANCMPYPVDRL